MKILEPRMTKAAVGRPEKRRLKEAVNRHTIEAFKRGAAGTIQKKIPRRKVFICYSHRDSYWGKMLSDQLLVLKTHGLVEFFKDTEDIKIGQDWKREIIAAIDAAKAAILLLSNYFFSSKFIIEEEIYRLLIAAEKEGLAILTVNVSKYSTAYLRGGVLDTLWRFQAANSIDKPLVGMRRKERDEVWVKIVDRIAELVDVNKS